MTNIFWRMFGYVCIVGPIYNSFWTKEHIFQDPGFMCTLLDTYTTIIEVNKLISWEICE